LRPRTIALCLFLAALVAVVFGKAVHYDFINYDDNRYVYENDHVRRGLTYDGLIWAFTHFHSENWHPLTTISHMVDCQLFGIRPGGHHLVNVLLHSIVVIGIFLVLEQASGLAWRSAFVAAVFAVHPLRAESVMWISERKDVLSGIFFVLTLALYIWYARQPGTLRYLLVTLSFVCGLMSKPMLVTLPFVLFLLDYWPLKRLGGEEPTSLRQLIIEKLPLGVLSAGACIVTVLAQRPTQSSLIAVPMLIRIENAIVAILTYLGQLFWPVDLAVFYPYSRHYYNAIPIFAATVTIVAITALVWIYRKTHRCLLVGWLWYLGMLVPVIGLVQVGLQSHADRYTYLPQIGILTALTWAICDLTKKWRYRNQLLSVSFGVVIALVGACGYRQASYWKDSISLWAHTLKVTKDNDRAHLCMAEALLQKGRLQEAIEHSQAAVDIRPENAGAYGRIPVVLTNRQASTAMAYWRERIKANALDTDAHNNLGVLLIQSGDPKAAVLEWESTLAIKPNDGNAQNNMAWVLATYPDATIRNGERAVELAESASKLPGGNDPLVLRTLAAAYAEDGQFARAIDTAESAMQTANGRQNLALVETLKAEIEQYRSGEPHREAAAAPPSN
jgi:tetratricopeptide (TPR) repeat protein